MRIGPFINSILKFKNSSTIEQKKRIAYFCSLVLVDFKVDETLINEVITSMDTYKINTIGLYS